MKEGNKVRVVRNQLGGYDSHLGETGVVAGFSDTFGSRYPVRVRFADGTVKPYSYDELALV